VQCAIQLVLYGAEVGEIKLAAATAGPLLLLAKALEVGAGATTLKKGLLLLESSLQALVEVHSLLKDFVLCYSMLTGKGCCSQLVFVACLCVQVLGSMTLLNLT
jgi:hypothetical protein